MPAELRRHQACWFFFCQVHHYLPTALSLSDIYISTHRRQQAAGPASRRLAAGADAQQNLWDDDAVQRGSSGFFSSGAIEGQGLASVPEQHHSIDGDESCASGSLQLSRGGWAADFDTSSFGVDPREAEDSRGIAANFKLVHRAAKALGSVPEMLSSRDFSEHGPDERAVILYVAFLCSRLLECSRDDRRGSHCTRGHGGSTWAESAGKTPSARCKPCQHDVTENRVQVRAVCECVC